MDIKDSEIISSISIGVVITCHNRRELTLSCLKSLMRALNHLEINKHIYLVDDGSTDGTSDAVTQAYPEVTLIEGSGNLYWNRGMYYGFKVALHNNHQFYLWLNDDVILKKDAIECLLSCYDRYKSRNNLGPVVVGSVSDPDTGKLVYGGHVKTDSRLLPRNKLIVDNESDYLCDTFNGNCVLIPNSVADRVGNIDFVFHHAMGDHDYGYRCTALGIPIYVCKGSVGFCKRDDGTLKLYSPNKGIDWDGINFIERLKIIMSPKNYPLKPWFIYSIRHLGPLWLIRFMKPYIYALFPSFFKNGHTD